VVSGREVAEVAAEDVFVKEVSGRRVLVVVAQLLDQVENLKEKNRERTISAR
jgi:hypothetical protein